MNVFKKLALLVALVATSFGHLQAMRSVAQSTNLLHRMTFGDVRQAQPFTHMLPSLYAYQKSATKSPRLLGQEIISDTNVAKTFSLDYQQQTVVRAFLKKNKLKIKLEAESKQLRQKLAELKKRNAELAAQADNLHYALKEPVSFAESNNPLFKAGVLSFQKKDEPLQGSITNFEFDEINTPEKTLNTRGYKVWTRLFKPSLKTKKILFLSVHGTFSDEKSFGVDETKLTTQALSESAKKMALGHKKAVDFVTFSWSGALDASHRQEAAGILAEYINLRRAEDPSIEQVVVFAHSHGCNVVLASAHQLSKPIDTAFLAACPDTEVKFEEPSFDQTKQYQTRTFNINTIFHCWGLEDVTQAAGSAESQKTLNRKVPLRINQNRKVYNVCLKADGQELNHVNIKYHLARHMHELLFCAQTQYPAHFDLEANVFDQVDDKPLMAIRHAEQADTIAHRLSDENKLKFQKTYNKEFDKKTTAWTRVIQAIWNETTAARQGNL